MTSEEKSLDRQALLDKLRQRQQETGQLVPPGMVYASGESEFIGKIPARTELTVLPADDVKDQKIGWTIGEVYSGCEVYLLDSDETIKSRWGLRPGMKVQAWDMEWTVIRTGFFSLALERENSVGILKFNKDNRKCWTCPAIINKKVLKSFNKSLVS